MKISIYLLRDPTDNNVKYIGLTSMNIGSRLKNHISYARNSRHTTPCLCWIRSLLEIGEKPQIELLEITGNKLRERMWIDLYKEKGYRLLNQSRGGTIGPVGCKRSSEFKEKLRKANMGNTHSKGRVLSESHKDGIRKALMGNTNSKGTKCSDYTRALISDKLRGHSVSVETIEKIRITKMKKKEIPNECR